MMEEDIKQSQPMVSVCLTSYKHSIWIKRCMDGILSQDVNFQYEIMVADDCSNDGTLEVLQDYQNANPDKIRLHVNKRRMGGMRNLVANLKRCKGKYIALMDADDYWICPNQLADKVKFLESRDDYVACFSQAKCEFRQGKDIGLAARYAPTKKEYTAEDVISRRFSAATSSIVYRNGLIAFPKWFFRLRYNGQRAMCKMLAKFGRFHCIQRETVVYTSLATGIVNTVFKGKGGRRRLFKNFNKMYAGLLKWFGNDHQETIQKEIAYYKAMRHQIFFRKFLRFS